MGAAVLQLATNSSHGGPGIVRWVFLIVALGGVAVAILALRGYGKDNNQRR